MDLSDVLPVALTWDSIATQVAAFLGTTLMISLIGVSAAIKFAPKVIGLLRRSIR